MDTPNVPDRKLHSHAEYGRFANLGAGLLLLADA
jgi:hypothetical protein